MDPTQAFAIAGIIIFIGFLSSLLFEKTKIPDILLLIFFGLFIGQTFKMFDPVIFVSITPYFSALALMIILFDSGLNLNFDEVLKNLSITSLHTILTFLVSMFLTAMITHFLFGYTLLISLLLGAILGGTGAVIVIPLVAKMRIDEETKTILTLESVFTTVICIVVAFYLMEIILIGGNDYSVAFRRLATQFLIAIVIGLIFGIIWLKILKVIYGKPYSFMITIAALFVLYAGVETLQGSGILSALIFGMVLSNKEEIVRMFKMETEFVFDEKIKQFHSEVSFGVRTFFFVYLGLVFTLSALNLWFFIVAIFIFFGILFGRLAITRLTVYIKKGIKKDWTVIWTMLPRGLAAAVLATIPIAKGIENTERFVDFAFMIIVFTVITAIIGVFITERWKTNNNKKDTKLEGEQNVQHKG